MPNWVYTNMAVEGAETALDRFARTVAGQDAGGEAVPLSFQTLIPRPADQDADWYRWNVANWGTKWDAVCDQKPTGQPSGGRMVYLFRTAWSFPEPVYTRLAGMFPELMITFEFEEEQGWGGTFVATGGTLELASSYDVPSSHADMLERGSACYCEHDGPVFPDCWTAAARTAGITDDEVLSTVERLGEGWSGGFSELLDTAQAVNHRPSVGRKTVRRAAADTPSSTPSEALRP